MSAPATPPILLRLLRLAERARPAFTILTSGLPQMGNRLEQPITRTHRYNPRHRRPTAITN